MPALNPALVRAENFTRAHGLQIPILLAPVAGACPPSLSIAVANAGGLGSCGALLMKPEAIRRWPQIQARSNPIDFACAVLKRSPRFAPIVSAFFLRAIPDTDQLHLHAMEPIAAMSAEHFDALCSSIGKLDEMDRRYVHLFDRYRVS